MNKSELVTYLRENYNMLRREAEDAIEAVIGAIKEIVCSGESVHISEFGDFKRVWKNEIKGYNFTKKVHEPIPAHWEPAFKPEKRFKEAVQENARK